MLLLLSATAGLSQTISYFNQGFLRQTTAELDRLYLGIGAGGVLFVPTGTGFFHATAGVEDAASVLVNLTSGAHMAVNQGTTTTVLHGNAGGLPSWASVNLATDVSGLLPNGNLANNSLTYNGLTVALGGSGTLTLASANFQNQGTTTTLLHGNAAGNPSWAAVNLATDVTGTLPGASVSGVWRLAGNALGAPGSFLGSTDNQEVQFRLNNLDVGSFTTANSVRLGKGSVASGNNSVAIGPNDGAFITTASALDSVAVGVGSTASADYAFALGPFCSAQGVSSLSLGVGNIAFGDSSVAIGSGAQANGVGSIGMGAGAVANNDGSMVLSDGGGGAISDTVANQFSGGFLGGSYWATYGLGMTVEDGAGAVCTLLNGTAHATVNVIANNQVFGTNGLFYVATNNGIAGALNHTTPLHTWGFLSLTNAQNINISVAGTYHPITNYNRIYTNEFRGTITGGNLTNTLAGWYRITLNVSCSAPTANDSMDADLMVNGTITEEIASHVTAPAGAGKFVNLAATGIQWLPANTKLQIGITDTTGTGNISVTHAMLTVGSP